jgi:predicted AlkP superfamily phosphohydrolase/phosphomutase
MFAYLDPGSGFTFLRNSSFLLPFLGGILGFLFLFFKFFWKFIKKFRWLLLFILVLMIIMGGIVMLKSKKISNKKILILGIDAMDTKISEKLIKENKLPNFSSLDRTGSYAHLKTITPPESCVVWASFATGVNPGKHGIFDFIMRNPKNYLPYFSLNEPETIPRNIRIGKVIIPLGYKIEVKNRLRAKTFWDILSKHKITSYIYFCPNTFPVKPIFGKLLSGMGVPDLYGTMGRYSFYTTESLPEKEYKGEIIVVNWKKNIINTFLYGPKVKSKNYIEEAKIPIKITIIPEKQKIKIDFQKNSFYLKEKEWSKWQKVSFPVSTFHKIHGIVKFYFKSMKPFQLYCSPINFDPYHPLFPISYPKDFSKKIAQKLGYYYTQGIPYDTNALSDGIIDEEGFLKQIDEILNEKIKILKHELKNFKNGIFFFYFGALDAIQHMFWRYIDSKHPLYEENSPYHNVIYHYYRKMDGILGLILKQIDKKTTLIVISDHGFQPFYYAVHLNSWLYENGYLSLKNGLNRSAGLFEGVDWWQTKAYALGFCGIYINKYGRESSGIVGDDKYNELKKEIAQKLMAWKDPNNGKQIIHKVYLREEIFRGHYTKDAPDLVVGFNPGYRASWQTALGGFPETLIEENKKKWSGDHLIDPEFVPGVIFINKKMKLDNPKIIDIAPTILEFFSLPSNNMEGKNLF